MLINRIRRFVAFRLVHIRRFLEIITNSIWYDSPFGTKPHASKQVYLNLAEIAKKEVYHEIEEYEQQTGFAIDSYWLHELALHTQVVLKDSPLCYAHGRILSQIVLLILLFGKQVLPEGFLRFAWPKLWRFRNEVVLSSLLMFYHIKLQCFGIVLMI
jgi:hypothetical protein